MAGIESFPQSRNPGDTRPGRGGSPSLLPSRPQPPAGSSEQESNADGSRGGKRRRADTNPAKEGELQEPQVAEKQSPTRCSTDAALSERPLEADEAGLKENRSATSTGKISSPVRKRGRKGSATKHTAAQPITTGPTEMAAGIATEPSRTQWSPTSSKTPRLAGIEAGFRSHRNATPSSRVVIEEAETSTPVVGRLESGSDDQSADQDFAESD